MAQEMSLTEIDEAERDFRAVLVPADATQPVQELVIHQAAGDALSCFINYCKQHFAKNGLDEQQKQAYKEQVKQHAKGQAISDDLFNQLSLTTTVDMVVLHPNRPETDWVAVNMYVDDKGMAKELPVNVRASAICHTCGLPQQIFGDVFIGKQFDNNEGFKRLDFGMKELGDETWSKRAKAINEKSRANAGPNAQRLKEVLDTPKLSPQEQEARLAQKRQEAATRDAARLKDAGNAAFNKGDFAGAAAEYTRALAKLGVDSPACEAVTGGALKGSAVAAALLSNRSACHLKLDRAQEALADADACVLLRPTWPKAFGRRADALESLDRYEEAREALEQALALKPATTKDLDDRLARIEARLGTAAPSLAEPAPATPPTLAPAPSN